MCRLAIGIFLFLITEVRAQVNQSHLEGVKAPSQSGDYCYDVCPESYYVNIPDREIEKSAFEVHVVSVFQVPVGTIVKGKYGAPPIVVRVFPTPKPVVLVLMSMGQANWQIRLSEGARIEKAFLVGEGWERSNVIGLSADRVQKMAHIPSFYRWERDAGYEASIENRISEIRKKVGQKEKSFQGAHTSDFFIVPFYLDYSRLVSREREFQDRISSQKDRAAVPIRKSVPLWKRPFSNEGIGQIATIVDRKIEWREFPSQKVLKALGTQRVTTRYPTAYVIDDEDTPFLLTEIGLVNLKNNNELRAPLGIGNFSLPHNLAYDSKRKRFLVVVQGETGFRTVTYSPRENKWQKLTELPEMQDLGQLAYDSQNDLVYAIPDTFGTYKIDTLLVFSPEMKEIKSIKLKNPILHEPHGLLHLSVTGNRVLFLVNPNQDTKAKSPTLYSIDPASGESRQEW